MFRMLTPKKNAEAQALKGIGQRAVYLIGAVFGLALMTPVALAALTAVTSIASAIIVCIAMAGLLIALPAINRWWRILVLKMLKASARINPVETLQLELVDRQRAFALAAEQSVQLTGKRDSLIEQLEEFKQKHGATDPGLQRICDKLSLLVDRFTKSYRLTGVKLDEFGRFVSLQEDRWKIAKSTGELARMLNAAQGGDVTQTFLSGTAVDTIRDELNNSFAQLDQILADEEMRQIAGIDPMPQLALTPALEAEPVGRT